MVARILVLAALALGDDAVAQVERTLQNLIVSIEDESRVEQGAFAAREQWCNGAKQEGATRLASFEDQAAQAAADVAEVDAAADEIAAAVQTMRAELNTSKGTSKRSLEEQLASELPLLSSKRTAATELTRKSVDLRHVVAAEKVAQAEVTASCEKHAQEHQKAAEARMDAHTLLEQAASLLQQAPPSFVQLEAAVAATAAAQSAMAAQMARGAAKLAKAQAEPTDPLAKARNHLAHLVTSLASSSNDGPACAKELKANKLALVWKQEELSRLAADGVAHTQAIEEAGNELADVTVALAELQRHQATLQQQQEQDTKALEKRALDHALLEKVVKQAVTVLKEAGARVQAPEKVLETVQALLTKQRADINADAADLAPRSSRGQRSVAGAQKAVEMEKSHLELAQSQHKVALAEMAQETDTSKDELAKIQTYIAELEKSCRVSPEDAARRQKEVETVEEAMRSIGGDAPARVHAPIAAPSGDMSPLERAAAEMGIAQQ